MPFQKKIINDPVYGFINIPNALAFEIIEHPFFQRLRNIKQLGLSNYVYPGANHTRFHHALGAMHLMMEAIKELRSKEISISKEEEEAAIAAILLHDIGHGPFSHCLEGVLLQNIHHEEVSLQMMQSLNEKFNGQLNLAIEIFTGKYPRKFLHQLVVEEKGIYSIEKFLTSRRLMYWQVYLHKTVIAAEQLLVKIFQRARELHTASQLSFKTPLLEFFLSEKNKTEPWIDVFAQLNDAEVLTNVNYWQHEKDACIANLSRMLVNRNLYKIHLSNEKISTVEIENKRKFHLHCHFTTIRCPPNFVPSSRLGEGRISDRNANAPGRPEKGRGHLGRCQIRLSPSHFTRSTRFNWPRWNVPGGETFPWIRSAPFRRNRPCPLCKSFRYRNHHGKLKRLRKTRQ